MLKAEWIKYTLKFNFTAITSRQSMTEKETYFVKIFDPLAPDVVGIGECALFRGLSLEDNSSYELTLDYICKNINIIDINSIKESSIKFGIETALLDLQNGGKRIIFNSPWIKGEEEIKINGLIWMGDFDLMLSRLENKINDGFNCIKIKIGGIDFNRELQLLQYIRESYNKSTLQLRLDANGSFNPKEALRKLERLAVYDIHSIEQPIKSGKWKETREITRNSPIDIALDEELIGNLGYDQRCYLLDATMPEYIILKPSLHGGFATCNGWIDNATEREIGWWATSALESNIGLNAIAQWAGTKHVTMPQGLGTGMLYINNISSPLNLKGDKLWFDPNVDWNLKNLSWQA